MERQPQPTMSYALILLITCIAIPLSGVATDVYSPSLPAIVKFFDVTRTTAKLTMTVFIVGFGIGQIIFGTLAEVYGRKWPLFASVFVFTLASLYAATAKNIELLLWMRLIQGVVAAGPSVICKAIVSDTQTRGKLKRATNYLVASWALGPTIAPVIGGYLQHNIGWQANFYFLFGFGLLLTLMTSIMLKETHHKRLPFHFGRIKQRFSEVVTHKAFFFAVVILGIDYAFIVVFNIFGPFLIQTKLGYTPVVYGKMAFLIGFAILFGAVSNRFLLNRFSSTQIIKFGLAVEIVTAIATQLTLHLYHMNLWTIVVPAFIIIAASLYVHINLMSFCLSLFSHAGGIAAGTMGALLSLFAGAITFFSSLVDSNSQHPMAWFFTIMALLSLLFYFLFIQDDLAAAT